MDLPDIKKGVDKVTPHHVPQWAVIAMTAMLSVLLTTGAHYLVLGRDMIPRAEVDRKLNSIQSTIYSIDRRLARIEGQVDRRHGLDE